MSPASAIAAGLGERIAATLGARNIYGDPEVNLANVAAGWDWWLRIRGPGPLTGFDVAQMNALQKLARSAAAPAHEDTALDIAGYALTAHGCAVVEGDLLSEGASG